MDLAAGGWGLIDGGSGLGIPDLLCAAVLSIGEWSPGRGGGPKGIWLGDREFDITGLRGAPTLVASEVTRLGLLWWLFPPALRGESAGPFRTMRVSNWLEMGGVGGLSIDTAGRFLHSLLLPSPSINVILF